MPVLCKKFTGLSSAEPVNVEAAGKAKAAELQSSTKQGKAQQQNVLSDGPSRTGLSHALPHILQARIAHEDQLHSLLADEAY